jgi:hypothetical protein
MDTGRFLVEVEQEIARLQHIADALRGIGGKSAASGSSGKRTMSAAARKKISLAQKKRWAKSAANAEPVRAKPKRTISAAGRRRIIAAQRKRWAKVKAQSKKTA